MGKKGFAVHLPNHHHCLSSLILVLRQGLMSKFSHLAFHPVISQIGLSVKTGIPPFSEAPLVITG
jgi:hypothetical protein